MNTLWKPAVIAAVDDGYDAGNASDGRSRFGAYLGQRSAQLRDEDAPLSADEFAAAVWTIATAPVMSPGYVRIRPDVRAVSPAWSEDGECRLMFDVHLPLLHGAVGITRGISSGWRDWQPQRMPGDDGPYRWLWEPEGTRPALLTTSVLRVTVDDTWNMPIPSTDLVRDARRSVAAVVTGINRTAGPMVARLRGEQP